jgi:para-nitrobenzyl esterase
MVNLMKGYTMIAKLISLSCLALMAGTAFGAEVPAMGHTTDLVIHAVTAKTARHLTVSSPAFHDQADIPFENTQYRGNRFPGLKWSKGPYGTRSYVVIMQGAPDRPGAQTSIHLVLFNIPATVRRLDPGLTTPPAGAVYGPNVHGLGQTYAGPHTHTLAKQAYHLQVFALDTALPTAADQSFEAIQAAMQDHVLADGDLIGYAAMDPTSPEAKQLNAQPAQ